MGAIGRPEKPASEKSAKISVSFPQWIFEFLKSLPNRSEFIAAAVAEKIRKEKIFGK